MNPFEGRYQKIASEGRAAWFAEDRYEPTLASWQHRLEGRSGTLLEIGCGVGRLVGPLSESGFQVTGVDLSATAIESARKRYPAATFLVIDIRQPWPFDEAQFDFVLDSDCLHHIAPPFRGMFFDEALRVLRPGGMLFVKTSVGLPHEDDYAMLRYDPATRCCTAGGEVINYMAEPEEVLSECAKAGFVIHKHTLTPGEPTIGQILIDALKPL